jgi:replication factor C subunit 2/4
MMWMLQSRCAILRFVKLTDEQVLSRVVEVCAKENVRSRCLHCLVAVSSGCCLRPSLCVLQVPRTPDGLEAIVFTAEGDMRHALNNLQVPRCNHSPCVACVFCVIVCVCVCVFCAVGVSPCVACVFCVIMCILCDCVCVVQSTYAGFGIVTEANVYKVCDQPHPDLMREILENCVSGDLKPALQTCSALWHDGVSRRLLHAPCCGLWSAFAQATLHWTSSERCFALPKRLRSLNI